MGVDNGHWGYHVSADRELMFDLYTCVVLDVLDIFDRRVGHF